ncbi:RagB/SusD family nutrient uptake outer membrane protein [Chitinophaga sp. 22321]|uniref:RagB/SusD family nutrient uptake outer membrane protein n=1 Tax=Chitinophaga hostae TaxID=2831022 RepID=A0ABS5IVQ8_9BACT|nr:RagB/SusD family nutrient uptake outer membrane protein [Chitinophaga hostae]MBS0026985.1 RagB/SusD family nutrient uptake outer membrane protein [Chitinophaga hostae]
MNKRNFKYIVAIAAGLQLAAACSDKFVTVAPKGNFLESSYYKNQQEAYNGLVAIYDMVGYQAGNYTNKTGAMDAASDDHWTGGGGSGDINVFQVMTRLNLLTPLTGPQEELWKKGFSGVYRANVLLSKLPGVPMDENLKKRYAAEAKVLRAHFYFDLVRLFKSVPLMTAPLSTEETKNITQATPEEVYKQIEQDLKDGIAEANLPDVPPRTTEGGRMGKGIAHALLGKVYLYEKKWTAAAAEFKEVNGETPGQASAKYNYKLVANFADLWRSEDAYKFNSESIFEVSYTANSGGNWTDGAGKTDGNLLNILCGPRSLVPTPATNEVSQYVAGWGFLIVSQQLEAVMKGDPRYAATILNMKELVDAKKATYSPSFDDTGFFLNKFVGRTSNISKGGGVMELNFPQNLYEIRLADTYLMEAEARIKAGEGSGAGTRAYQLLNAVRARVGLPAIDATFDNIFKERRLELAGEGHRFFDLVRTGQAAAVLNAIPNRSFVPNKNEILPIPYLELENTKLKQTPEWSKS